MHRRVCRIKASEKTEVKYMQAWEEKVKEREDGREEGLKEGLKVGISRTKRVLKTSYQTVL